MVSLSTCRSACLITLLTTTVVGVILIGGCGATRQADFWRDPSYSAAPMKKIMVIAMQKDQLKRRMWEDAIVTEFGDKKHAGTVAVASYQLFPNDVPDSLELRLNAEKDGFDGILLVARVQRDATTSEVPGYTTSEPITRYSHRWNAYRTYYQEVYHSGYLETGTMVSVRTDLLVPKEDGRLVWSITSQELDPTSAKQFRSSVADGVLSQLKKERFIH